MIKRGGSPVAASSAGGAVPSSASGSGSPHSVLPALRLLARRVRRDAPTAWLCDDFVLLSEFSEREGPVCVGAWPARAAQLLDCSEFVVRIMAVDAGRQAHDELGAFAGDSVRFCVYYCFGFGFALLVFHSPSSSHPSFLFLITPFLPHHTLPSSSHPSFLITTFLLHHTLPSSSHPSSILFDIVVARGHHWPCA